MAITFCNSGVLNVFSSTVDRISFRCQTVTVSHYAEVRSGCIQLEIGEVIEWHPATTSNLQQGVHLTFHSHIQILSSV